MNEDEIFMGCMGILAGMWLFTTILLLSVREIKQKDEEHKRREGKR